MIELIEIFKFKEKIRSFTMTSDDRWTESKRCDCFVFLFSAGNGFVTGVAIATSATTPGEPTQAYVTGQVAVHRTPTAAAVLNVAAAAAASQSVYSRPVAALTQTSLATQHARFHPYPR